MKRSHGESSRKGKAIAVAVSWPGLRDLLDNNDDWQKLVDHNLAIRSIYGALFSRGATDDSYMDWVRLTATQYCKTVKEITAKEQNIPWPFPLGDDDSEYLSITTLEAVALWLLIFTDTGTSDLHFLSASGSDRLLFLNSLHKLASPIQPPVQQTQAEVDGKTLAERAFELSERMGPKGNLPSAGLYKLLLECSKAYQAGGFLSPYTSLVGPSGMGKSFAVKQLAVVHGLYVSYTSLAGPSSKAVPGRSTLAWTVQNKSNEERSHAFWEVYLRISTELIEASRRCGITPMAHFYLQYHSAFDGAQQLLANLVADEARLDKPRSSPRVIANRLQTIVKDAMPILVENGWNKAPVLGDATIRGDTQSLTVICIDEATGLFSPDDRDESSGRYRPSISFRAFRSALRSFSQNKVGTMPVLGLLLDTSSHITDFAPPASTDASQKYPTFHKLLRPIYYLDTWDVFASDPPSQGKKPSWLEIACQRNDGNDDSNFLAHGPDGSIDHQVFMARFGRPLWASVVTTATDMATDAKTGDEKDRIFQRALDHIRSLAYDKLTGTTPDNSIALLLYRLQFHVQDHRLAENLVARWMHYFSYVAMDRTWVCTCQPSEPVLALAAAQKLLDHKTRCRALRDFVQMHLHGVLHAGDCGEVVASLLLIFAADAHLDPGHPKTVSLSAFLTTLLGDINNGDDSEWADGEILLTHFNRLRLRGNQSLTAKHLISAFVLGQGFVLPQGMAGADLLVPVWLRAEQRMGALLIQVKNRANGTLTKTMCAHARGSMEMAEHALPFLKTTKVFGMYISLRGKPGKDGSPHEWLPSRSGRLPIVVTAGFALSVFPVLKGPKPGGFAASANVEDDMEQILRQLLNNVGQVVLPDDRIEGVDSILYTREPL